MQPTRSYTKCLHEVVYAHLLMTELHPGPARYRARTSHKAETGMCIYLKYIYVYKHPQFLITTFDVAHMRTGCQDEIYIGLGLTSINSLVNVWIVLVLHIIIGGMCM